jgi:hypothetical protein
MQVLIYKFIAPIIAKWTACNPYYMELVLLSPSIWNALQTTQEISKK